MPFSSTAKARPFSHYQIALVILAVLPLVVVFGLMAWWKTQDLRDSLNEGMLRTAEALSLAVDREIGIVRAGLETLADSEAIDRGDIQAFYREAVRAAEKRPGSWIALTDRAGPQLVNTGLSADAPLPNRLQTEAQPPGPNELPTGTASYIKKVFADGRANNSHLFTSLLKKSIVTAVNVPVLRNGTVTHVVSVTFPPESLADLVRATVEGTEQRTTVIDGNGFIVVSSQGPEFIGKKIPAAFGIPLGSGPAQGVDTGKALTGESVYRAYARSPVTGWTVAIAVSRADAEKEVAIGLVRTMAVSTAGIVLSILLALWFAKRLRAPMMALAAKAAGKPGSTPSPGFVSSEFIELGRAIDAGIFAREAEAMERELRVAAEARKEEADAANRAKDQFLAMLGHELRNPLAAISNAVTVMERSPAASPAMTPIVKRQSEHLRKLVDDLLDVARVTSGKIRLMLENVDLFELASACVDNFVRTGRSANHDLDLDLAGGHAFVYADRHRMTQVLTNLLDNALKFTPPKGRITVTVTAEGADIVLKVKDTGAGIPRDSLSRIFDVFAQGDHSLDRSRTGLGLGLALAKSLVELQHGRITAESAGPGKGAVFTVRMPRVQNNSAAASGGVESEGTVHKKRVLVVEDQADTREALRKLLELDGHTVAEAIDGMGAIAGAERSVPEVAFVDLGLPDIDGFEVARAFRNNPALRGVRLIALTGFGLPEDREKALQAGFDAFVVKPIEMHVLRQALS